MEIKNLLVGIDFTDDMRKTLAEKLPGAKITFGTNESMTKEQLAEADVIFGNPAPADLSVAKKLRWMQLWSAGFEPYMAPGILSKEVQLTNATGAYGLTVAEHMLGVLLALYKRLGQYYENQLSRIWRDEGRAKTIRGANVLVVGLGDIGSTFAGMVKALGAKVTGIKRDTRVVPACVDALTTIDQLDALLPQMDVVFLVVPSSPETVGLMDERRLRLMKPGAVLLNCGRGDAVDTDALVKVLSEGEIAAGLDVVKPEPLPEDHPLWGTKNVILTPHVAGGFHLEETRQFLEEITLRNMEAYLTTGKVPNNRNQ